MRCPDCGSRSCGELGPCDAEVEANRCYFCGISDPSHNPEDCADFAQWELELVDTENAN